MSYFPNPLQQLIPSRVRACLGRLHSLVWEDRQDLPVLGGPVNDRPLSLADGQRQPLTAVVPGETFAGPGDTWRQRWFKLAVPAAKPGQEGRRVLFWDSQGETTVYIDGTPWAGIDIAHRYCVLPDAACELWLDTGTYQTAIWYDAPKNVVDQFGCRFDGAWICCRNAAGWQAYWDLHCLEALMDDLLKQDGWSAGDFGLKEPLDDVPVVLRRLLRGLDAVCNALDVHGVDAAAETLRGLYSELRAAPWQGKAALCGHAHIDLVWLWPESEGVRKAVHSFATVLRLMDQYPEFRFTHSQPASYNAVRQAAPTLYDQVLGRIRDGQWEATGGFEVESDVNLPCGEALARSLAYGQRRFAELRGGAVSRNVWIPDVFGYSNCLPQIMKLGGISSFFTTKMTWSSVTRFPHNAFVWRGADGSDVLAFLCPVGYNERVELSALTRASRNNRQSGIHDTTLLPQGVGDGGGGPTEEMCERARRFADLAGVPKTGWTCVEDFFDGLARGADELPIYQGELYLEMHRGVYTTQAHFKQNYRAAERALQAHEASRVLHGQPAAANADWLRVCFAQFHDALPGSSIGLVYEQMNPELQQIAQRQMTAARSVLEASSAASDAMMPHAFNPLPFPRTAVVRCPDRSDALQVVDVPALGTVPLRNQRNMQTGTKAQEGRLDNGMVQAEFSATGKLERLCIDGEPLSLRQPAEFVLYPDYPAQFDAWDIDRHTLQLGQACAENMQLTVAESGPVRAVLVGEAAIGEQSRLRVRYVVDAGLPYLHVELDVDWREEHKLLKYHLFTGYQGQMTRYGAPFGSTLRPQLPGYANDDSQWEVPGSRWAAVSNETEAHGLAVITEAKYGFSCRDGNLGLSLLRAPKHPDPNADRGTHRIRFAIGRHAACTCDGRMSTAAAAEAFYTPMVVFNAAAADIPPPPFELGELGTLVPSWVMPAEQGAGWILRAHETAGQGGSVLLTLRDATAAVRYVDFLENALGEVENLGGGRFLLRYTPYQVISVSVRV